MNSSNSRRSFILHACVAGSTLAAGQAFAQAAGPMVGEADLQAAALGYKTDTTKVDVKKYPQHAVQQDCANCQLFQGEAKNAPGGCPLYPGKQVMATAWCSAWAKKAG